jgi:hypothetical protein
MGARTDDLLDLPAKLVSIAAASGLQMFILEAKHKMTEEELMRHLPQLATQAIVTYVDDTHTHRLLFIILSPRIKVLR